MFLLMPLLCLLIPQKATPSTVPEQKRFVVDVRDKLGAAISQARVIVHPSLFARRVPDLSLETDRTGKVEVSIARGYFDVCVMADAFTPACQKVRMQGKDFKIQFRLSVSSAVVKEIGDTFQ